MLSTQGRYGLGNYYIVPGHVTFVLCIDDACDVIL